MTRSDIECVIKTHPKRIMCALRKFEKDWEKFLNYSYPSIQFIEQCYLLFHEKTTNDFKCKCGDNRVFDRWNTGYLKNCKNCSPLRNYSDNHSRLVYNKKCKNCNALYETLHKPQDFCSVGCATAFKHSLPRKEMICPMCNKSFLARDMNFSKNIKGERVTCSKSCSRQHTLLHRSEEERIRIGEKREETILKRYGVPGCDLWKYKRNQKMFAFPSGRTVRVEGYEDIALSRLLLKYHEDDLLVGKEIQQRIKMFTYLHPSGRKRRYYPDIFIISENKIVEVKSTWTIKLNTDINPLKKKSVEDRGFLFEYMIII